MGRGTLAFKGGTIVLPDGTVPRGTVVLSGGKVVALLDSHADTEGVTIDVEGRFVCPALIDLHVHGGGGYGFDWDRPWAEWEKVAILHARHGVSGLLATVPAPHGRWDRLKEFEDETGRKDWRGSRVLGLHFEGPYLHPRRRGAWPEASLVVPSEAACRELLQAAGRALKIITMAPDLPQAMRCVALLASRGVIVSIGHTDATYEQTVQAVKAGATRVTHLYNAMSGFHHRDPGAVGAALDLSEVSVEVICDGVHVHPAALRLALRTKGIDGVSLVTDGSPFAGVEDAQGELAFGQFPVRIVDGVCRTPDGGLAGSLLTLDRAVANAVRLLGVTVSQAVLMASLVPARTLGMDRCKGSLAPGKDADIVVMDNDFRVEATLIGGRLAYVSPEGARRFENCPRLGD